ncbi:large ribosomal subunit protein bL20-like isoform X2 [Artemia franciscana]|uniref:large ribosomal subunit protein bL20-like isoform X2 n=1 Tax=Artemia franciscana TaxID=6661 RepID=UPI0032DB7860
MLKCQKVKCQEKMSKSVKSEQSVPHFEGRKRNCYSVAVRYVHRALAYTTNSRKLKKKAVRRRWIDRIHAGAAEFGSTYEALITGLGRCHISLNHQTLSNLAVWEPRTFKSLVHLSSARLRLEPPEQRGLNNLGSVPSGVLIRGMLK